MKSSAPHDRFVLGLVGPPFGLEGFVKVKPFSGETAHFSRLKTLTLRHDERETSSNVAEVIKRNGFLLIRFEGIDSPEAAAALNGAEIIASREYAAPLQKGEYYIEDLKGLSVTDESGKVLGTISDVVDGGGGQLAEVKLASGEKRFAPFRKEFFGELSLGKGTVILLQPWILDDE